MLLDPWWRVINGGGETEQIPQIHWARISDISGICFGDPVLPDNHTENILIKIPAKPLECIPYVSVRDT